MFSKTYPHLHSKYANFDNFEIISDAIERHFGDLFKLDVLDSEATKSSAPGSYMDLFRRCMDGLRGLYTVDEVVKQLTNLLHEQRDIKALLLSQFIFVPSIGARASNQLGFLEKIATERLGMAEPLTLIDMMRAVNGLNTLSKTAIFPSVRVLHLNHLQAFDAQAIGALKVSNKALIVNFNRDIKAMPKWGIIDLRQADNLSVYCETPLTEPEKRLLESSLHMTGCTYVGAVANSLPSTGYTALAWLDNNITKAWNFDVNADFAALLQNFIMAQFGGDQSESNLIYRLMPSEVRDFCKPSFRYIASTKFSDMNDVKGIEANCFQGGRAMSLIGYAAVLGQLLGEEFRPGDIASVIKLYERKRINKDQVTQYFYQSGKTLPPRFATTLTQHQSPKLLDEAVDAIILTVPKKIDLPALGISHRKACRQTNTSDTWLDNLPDSLVPREWSKKGSTRVNSADYIKASKEEYTAVMMVLTLLRAKAKKRHLHINLPNDFQLNTEEQRFIIRTLSENAYITEFEVPDNASLNVIKKELLPTFARNRWLMEKGYRPPMVDDYWKQAARYWLLHLHEYPHVLTPRAEHDFFKRCVLEMGLLGIKAVLTFLNDDESREQLELVYGPDAPAFYAACRPDEMREYLGTLINYLRKPESFFPFSEFGMSYQEGNDRLFIDLLGQINQLQRFEKITLTDFIKPNLGGCKTFLNTLIEKARAHNWVGLLYVPELEDKSNTTDAMGELRAMYGLLNDVMLGNRHQIAASDLLKRIEDATTFNDDVDEARVVVATHRPIDALDDEATSSVFDKISDRDSWPLNKGGDVQLQLQQQQQIQQNRQIQQEQQRVHLNHLEVALAEELVDYRNIDQLMGKFYRNFLAENPVWDRSASLKLDTESPLQGFFHTWINSNPAVLAPLSIRLMTQDAAKALIRKHRLLSSGLSVENLPKGFYTQKSKDGYLILCYSAELGHVSAPNALTLHLDAPIPEATGWKGDFRQLNLSKYIGRSAPLDEEDWQHMILFSQLQPDRDYTADYDEFYRINGGIGFLTGRSNKAKCIKFWPIFLQVWQYKGQDGVKEFFAKTDRQLTLNMDLSTQLLLQHQSQDIKRWFAFINKDENYLRALGQVYHRYGNKGLQLLLAKLRQINTVLGEDFFNHFNHFVMKSSANFNCFITESFFVTMDDMIAKLKPAAARPKMMAWQAVLSKHTEATTWDSVERLWQGFAFFLQELEQLGLELEGHEFDEIRPENMLVCIDRILASLKHIPDVTLQQRFLSQLPAMDRTHGGVPYALQYEGFKYFEKELELHDFNHGAPTYAPDLVLMYRWNAVDAALKMQRTVASQRQFSHEAYPALIARLGNNRMDSKHVLMWLLHTQYSSIPSIDETIHGIETLNPHVQETIARHIHHAVHVLGHQQIKVNLTAMRALEAFCLANPSVDIRPVLTKYPQGTWLEALSLLEQTGRWDEISVKRLVTAFNAGPASPDYWRCEGYKLAVLLGVEDERLISQFFDITSGLLDVVKSELRLLITQLLSLNFETSDLLALKLADNWADLLGMIEAMKREPANTAFHRIHFIEQLNARGLQFKYSKTGEFRALTTKQNDGPEGLSFFVDHEDRLWTFMQAHIAVPTDGLAADALQPIVRFLKRLQLNRTYLNEIEPLLASLEKTETAKYWSANYFYELLRALQPQNEQTSFPISLLKVMLEEEMIAAKAIDSVVREFPKALIVPIQTILKNTVFDRTQQAKLSQIALREFNWQGSVSLLQQIMATLSLDAHAKSRGYALDILAKSRTHSELESNFADCQWLLQCSSLQDAVSAQWTKSAAIWLKAISAPNGEKELFWSIKSLCAGDGEKQVLILHILAWSTLNQGLKDRDLHEYELNKKAPKLVTRLGSMSMQDLVLLAQCYPEQPCPGADDILRMIKSHQDGVLCWADRIDKFVRKPFSEARGDYGVLLSTRDADLRRMIKATQVSRGDVRSGITTEYSAELTLIFAHLKNLESGAELIRGETKPISKMSQLELQGAFNHLSKASIDRPNDDTVRAEIWAVLFEVLARTTRKYPHLAQQFALIANDLCIDADSRVLQLATGEGKSHFVAMRAARHAGCGKVVDVCTAKRTLAERDLEDYQSFFSYLGLSTAYIHPKSSHADYVDTKIHYTTMGDLSLFWDEQSYSGQPIDCDRERRVGLFDEFDFIRYEEGRKTQYNYARPTGKTPKQMTWFYQAVNAFYIDSSERIIRDHEGRFSKSVLKAFVKVLTREAGDNEEKQGLIQQILKDPLQLVQWLQSAHEAHKLQWGIGFTVREENIAVGDELYPMREVIPLSSDNQKMVGSTFSAGVHQLLAVRLNSEARCANQPQNVHIHPESHIISSQVAAQRMLELWGHWEGFSGTISAAQAKSLYREMGTEVLHVPTNQRDLRDWNKPQFFNRPEARLDALVHQLRHCMAKKQSILFSCKNDLQVTELKAQLEGELSQAELKSVIFYTNEDPRSASDVLNEKREMENRRGGKKQNGICLVASGFGRGDNVDVEAVFLFNVNDTNDLLQKGGRTARNGEEGAVFQFYLSNDLKEEETLLHRVLHDMHVDVPDELAQVPGDNEAEQTFERVMLLREFVFSVQNEANQGYHNAIAKYSRWGMGHLGQLEDIEQRTTLMMAFSHQLKHLEKQWIGISSQRDDSNADKIEGIIHVIEQKAKEFSERYNEVVGHELSSEFRFERQSLPPIELVVAKSVRPGATDIAVATICGALAHLPDLTLSDEIACIPPMLGQLAKDAELLQRFASRVLKYDSLPTFAGALYIVAEQVARPSERWNREREAAEKRADEPGVFTHVSDEVRIAFDDVMSELLPELQTKIIDYLQAKHLLSREGLLRATLPVLTYLAKFDPNAQKRWGDDYIDDLDRVLGESSHQTRYQQLLSIRLQNSPTMSLAHLDGLWGIAKGYALDEAALGQLLHLMGAAVNAAPEHRIRMLTTWESWAKTLDKDKSKVFLTNYCKVMTTFSEGSDWDTFEHLVKQTQAWWNKGGDGAYQQDLLNLWENLAIHSQALPALNQFIKWTVAHAHKSWFQLLSICLSLPPQRLLRHGEQIIALWDYIDTQAMKKRDKTASLQQCIEGIKAFYAAIQRLEEAVYEQQVSRLSGLEAPKFKLMLDLMQTNTEVLTNNLNVLMVILDYMSDPVGLPLNRVESLSRVILQATTSQLEYPNTLQPLLAAFEANRVQLRELGDDKFNLMMRLTENSMGVWLKHPDVLRVLLTYMSHPRITIQCVERLNQILLHSVLYSESHPEITTQDLLLGVERFKHQDENHLFVLLELFNDNALHVLEPLFDQAVAKLTSVRKASRGLMQESVHQFYDVAKANKGDPAAMFEDHELKSWFASADVPIDVRRKRTILMHLHQQGIMKTGERENRAYNAHDYQWDAAKNDAFLKLGFEHYIENTKKILGKPPKVNTKKACDLSVTQQVSLLRLADELLYIGASRPGAPLETLTSVDSLEKGLGTLMSKYGSSWFKSAGRKAELSVLQYELSEHFKVKNGGETRYEVVLKAISDAKLAAIADDGDYDATHSFKMNRGGKSRYFNTLNQMQDMVLRHWACDLPAVQRLEHYQPFVKMEFSKLACCLYERVRDFDDATHLLPGDIRNKELGRKLSQLFSSRADKESLQSLRRVLEAVDTKLLDSLSLGRLIIELRKSLKRLPGQLATLAKEVLIRGDSLVLHLQEQESIKLTTFNLLGSTVL